MTGPQMTTGQEQAQTISKYRQQLIQTSYRKWLKQMSGRVRKIAIMQYFDAALTAECERQDRKTHGDVFDWIKIKLAQTYTTKRIRMPIEPTDQNELTVWAVTRYAIAPDAPEPASGYSAHGSFTDEELARADKDNWKPVYRSFDPILAGSKLDIRDYDQKGDLKPLEMCQPDTTPLTNSPIAARTRRKRTSDGTGSSSDGTPPKQPHLNQSATYADLTGTSDKTRQLTVTDLQTAMQTPVEQTIVQPDVAISAATALTPGVMRADRLFMTAAPDTQARVAQAIELAVSRYNQRVAITRELIPDSVPMEMPPINAGHTRHIAVMEDMQRYLRDGLGFDVDRSVVFDNLEGRTELFPNERSIVCFSSPPAVPPQPIILPLLMARLTEIHDARPDYVEGQQTRGLHTPSRVLHVNSSPYVIHPRVIASGPAPPVSGPQDHGLRMDNVSVPFSFREVTHYERQGRLGLDILTVLRTIIDNSPTLRGDTMLRIVLGHMQQALTSICAEYVADFFVARQDSTVAEAAIEELNFARNTIQDDTGLIRGEISR